MRVVNPLPINGGYAGAQPRINSPSIPVMMPTFQNTLTLPNMFYPTFLLGETNFDNPVTGGEYDDSEIVNANWLTDSFPDFTGELYKAIKFAGLILLSLVLLGLGLYLLGNSASAEIGKQALKLATK